MSTAVKEKQDFTSGKVLKKLIYFAIPMAIATLLQVLFNSADIAIVGQFAGYRYQAAVGATSSVAHLTVNLFMGISIGANVAMANAVGAKDTERQSRVVHTAIAISVVSGMLILLVGMFVGRPILKAIGTPAEIIDYSVIYLQIYFFGAPAMMIYNFGAALMRGVGETKKPLFYLLVTGILNVVINIVTVVFLDWHVIGVALGTTVSLYVAAVWILLDLRKAQGGLKYSVHKTHFHIPELKQILLIGIPTGLSSCFFSLSNLLVQSAINAFGDLAIAGSTVANNMDTICDAFAAALEKSILTFVGQNIGAKKPERINRIMGAGLFAIVCCQVIYGTGMLCFGKYVCMLYNRDASVIEWAMKRVYITCCLQVITCLMYTYGGALRGMGYSIFPMCINLFFTCVLRVVYVLFIYPYLPADNIQLVFMIYPITWFLSGVMQMLMYWVCVRQVKVRFKQEKMEFALKIE